MKTATTVCAQE